MKHVTISVEDDVACWADAWAARHDTSVSRMLGEELRRKMEDEKNYDLAKQRFLSKAPKPLKSADASYPSRESVHER